MVATLLSPRWGLSVPASYPRLAPWAVLYRSFAAILCPRFAAILFRSFAAIHGGLEPQGGVRMQPTALAVGKKQKPTSPSRGERS
jgi:hypothetical protein